VSNLNGARASIVEFVAAIRHVIGAAADGIGHKTDPLPFPADIDTTGLQMLGPPPVTPLTEAVASTVELFRGLQGEGRLVPEEHGLAVVGDTAIDGPAHRPSVTP
jgi:hypothetical protein